MDMLSTNQQREYQRPVWSKCDQGLKLPYLFSIWAIKVMKYARREIGEHSYFVPPFYILDQRRVELNRMKAEVLTRTSVSLAPVEILFIS